MKRAVLLICVVVAIAALSVISCVHQPAARPADGEFPAEIAAILVNKCAISGCHNAASYQNADNLLLDSWEHLFQGGSSGAEVVPYSVKFSPLLYFCNTDSAAGPVATPTMPLSTTSRPQTPLTKLEYSALVNWIAAGAPDKNGNIAFASEAATRQKMYVSQQGCDLMAVIDAKSHLIMRYIPIGLIDGQTESPHDVAMSSDGRYVYVPFFAGNSVQKIDTRTDQVVSMVNLAPTTTGGGITSGGWSLIAMSPQDTSFMVSGYNSPGYLVNVNTEKMKVNQSMSINVLSGYPPGAWAFPHGIAANVTFDTFITCMQWGNALMKYSRKGGGLFYKYISLNGLPPVSSSPSDSASPDPHQVLMSPDCSRYFVTCEGTNKVVIMNAKNDSILASIPVGEFPQEMEIYPAKNFLFVVCMEDKTNPIPGMKGSVYVINYNTMHTEYIIYGDFYQPHDVAVDVQNGSVYVVSSNYSPGGPAPHHVTGCGTRSGWYSIIDLNTMRQSDGKRYEMTYFPYAISARFYK